MLQKVIAHRLVSRPHVGSSRPFWVGVFVLAILGLLAFSIVRGAQLQASGYEVDVKVDMVGLFATVHDRAGKLVTGLNRNDFIVYDNGVPQTISQFSREYVPLSVVILLDASKSMAGMKLDNAKRSLEQFLKRLSPGDEAMLITFRTGARVAQRFTKSLEMIRREIKGLQGNGSTALYDAILIALEESRKSQNRRRTLLLLSDGINTYGKAELKETIIQLRRRGAELFAIGLETDFPEDARDKLVTRAVLDDLTRSAGGEAFVASDARNLGKICEAISERMHNQYAFAYYPPRTGPGQWHTIRVETRVSGYRVVASKAGYFLER